MPPASTRHRQQYGSHLTRPSTPPDLPPLSSHPVPKSILSFGVVCSSNINRSMEAHQVFGNAGLTVESYGTGNCVKLPGRSKMEPRTFKFGTPYEEMYNVLAATTDDENFFTYNGVLPLCRRGAAVKTAPQKWQDTPNSAVTKHDIVIAFEERIFDAVVNDLQTREPTEDFEPIHVICLDTKDHPREAKIQGRIALELCWLLEKTAQDGGREVLLIKTPEILEGFQSERMVHTPVKILYQLCYL